MSFTLVMNSKNTYGSGNNTYKYDFIQGNFNIYYYIIKLLFTTMDDF